MAAAIEEPGRVGVHLFLVVDEREYLGCMRVLVHRGGGCADAERSGADYGSRRYGIAGSRSDGSHNIRRQRRCLAARSKPTDRANDFAYMPDWYHVFLECRAEVSASVRVPGLEVFDVVEAESCERRVQVLELDRTQEVGQILGREYL